jgi:hypothetical protein
MILYKNKLEKFILVQKYTSSNKCLKINTFYKMKDLYWLDNKTD